MRPAQPHEVLPVPLDRAREAVVERDLRRPAERPEALGAQPVAEVVPGTVRDVHDLRRGGAGQFADPPSERHVLELEPTTDVVDRTELTVVEDPERGGDPVGDVEELAPLPSFGIDGHRPALERADRERRDDTFDMSSTRSIRTA